MFQGYKLDFKRSSKHECDNLHPDSKQRQKVWKFKAILGYIAKSCLKRQKRGFEEMAKRVGKLVLHI